MKLLKNALIWTVSLTGGAIGTPFIVVNLRTFYLQWKTPSYDPLLDYTNIAWAVGAGAVGFYMAAIFADRVITKIHDESSY